jgi:hypothetical protein
MRKMMRKKFWLVILVFLGLIMTRAGAEDTGSGKSSIKKKGPPPGAPTDKRPEAYAALSREEIERMWKGEIIVVKEIGREYDTSKGMIKAALIFNQPIDKVWDLMTQGWRQEEYLPHLDRSPLIKKYPDGDLTEFQIMILLVDIRYRVRGHHYKDRYHIEWALDENFDNDMKRLEGFWNFYWIDDGHTLGRYGTNVETGFGVPKWIQDFLTRRDLPESLGRVKKWLDSGGSYKKPDYEPLKHVEQK